MIHFEYVIYIKITFKINYIKYLGCTTDVTVKKLINQHYTNTKHAPSKTAEMIRSRAHALNWLRTSASFIYLHYRCRDKRNCVITSLKPTETDIFTGDLIKMQKKVKTQSQSQTYVI